MNKKGFTIIELIVVMAVFLLVLSTTVLIFTSIIRNQKKILTEQEILNEVSYIIEHVSKALRMAKTDDGSCLGLDYVNYNYKLTHQKSNFFEGIKFVNQSDGDVCQEFYLDDATSILYEVRNGLEPVPLTSNKFKVNYVKFIINGTSTLDGSFLQDGSQSKVTIVLDIESKSGDLQNQHIQTTISQRNLNIE